ncbi:hypothetical protein SBA5_190013 [Candidatus Sulfotelmatomonas gaucii]|uniref:Uncharacterized protein n=1 Tax=Candidatus Sulfuritelmatomonas gaucii TaxID=2043161 RepID=A0A2N9L6V5_9BACT|nr:hypothetical protein SBA5_190013 [Candidatus Sulfotelmatomonas gaucii]
MHFFQCRLLLRVGCERGFVGLVGRGPERGAEGDRIVVEGGELERAVATAAGAVGFVIAYADGNAGDTLVRAIGALAGPELSLRFKIVDFFDAVLDEEWLGEAFQLELAHAAVEFGEHGFEDGIFFGVGAGGLGVSKIRNSEIEGQKRCGRQKSSEETPP